MSTAKQLNLFDIDPPISPIVAVWNGQTLYRSTYAPFAYFGGSPIVTADFATFQPMIAPKRDPMPLLPAPAIVGLLPARIADPHDELIGKRVRVNKKLLSGQRARITQRGTVEQAVNRWGAVWFKVTYMIARRAFVTWCKFDELEVV